MGESLPGSYKGSRLVEALRATGVHVPKHVDFGLKGVPELVLSGQHVYTTGTWTRYGMFCS